jgi:CBS domain-containing protein
MSMADSRRPTREELLALKGRSLRTSDLLTMFGTRVRNHHTVPMIQEALHEAGLDTHPSFTTCGLTTEMLVVAKTLVVEAEDEAEEEVLPGTLPQQSFKIGDVPSARNGVESVNSSALLSTVTHTMRQKNYSQLPVIDGLADLKGVITWDSIAARYEKGEVPTLATAMIRDDLPLAEVHQELFTRLPELQRCGYLLVRENNGTFAGIITGADITARFHKLAQPFFLVGEIEFRIRRCLGPKLAGDPVRALGKKYQLGDFSRLMFGDYVKLLATDQQDARLAQLAETNWATLGWTGVNQAQFVAQLDRVRAIRNQIAHFDEQPLTEQQTDELYQFSGLLKQLL